MSASDPPPHDPPEPPAHKHFAELFVRYQNRIFAFILSLHPDRQDAEDIFQQTSVLLWTKWEEYDVQRDFVRWACGIAFNVVRNHRQKRTLPSLPWNDGLLQAIADLATETQSKRAAEIEALAICRDKLPAEQRDLLDRCYSSGQKIRQTAEQLGHSAEAVYTRLRRIRRTLLRCIERELARKANP